MVTIKTDYVGQLRTQATHVQSNNNIITDAPTDNNGKGEAFSPTDLVAGSLCSCMMTIMGIMARRDGFDLDGMKGEVTKVMVADPRRISEIHIDFTWSNPHPEEKMREKLKRGALTCPVALSLHPDIEQKINFDF